MEIEMSKYIKITNFLMEADYGIWEPSFKEIEEVLGFSLPASARQYQAWWANQMRSQSLGWQSAGWKTASVDLDAEKITFIYVGGKSSDEGPEKPAAMTILDAKLGLAASFGVKPEQVEIVVRA